MENKENEKVIHKASQKPLLFYFLYYVREKRGKKNTIRINGIKNKNGTSFFFPHMIRVESNWSVKKLYLFFFGKLNHSWNLARHI